MMTHRSCIFLVGVGFMLGPILRHLVRYGTSEDAFLHWISTLTIKQRLNMAVTVMFGWLVIAISALP